MQTKKIAIIATGIAVLGVGWYLFRPELLFINEKVNEAFPVSQASSAQPVSILSGQFRGIAHQTSGTATIYKTMDGKNILRLTNFATSNGPDVRVYLVAAGDAPDNGSVKKAGYIDLGKLKGNQGDQNYELPAEFDPNTHHAVTIWCARFSVNFGTAPLMMDKMSGVGNAPTPQSIGQFRGIAHETKGTASIYDLGNGKRVLRLSDFATSNGPDVHVYLVAANDAADSSAVKKAGFIDVGKLKGNQGDQNYELPAEYDPNRHRAVTIWCARFNVNFGTAPLMSEMPAKN
jgi:hypothetical protein